MAGSRNNVGIFYKELYSADDWKDVASFAKDWDGSLQVSYTTSAYSTMCLQKDDKIGFFFEENYRYIGKKDGHNNDGYDGIYTSYYNTCQNYVLQYITMSVQNKDGSLFGTVGTYVTVMEWISDAEAEKLKEEGY